MSVRLVDKVIIVTDLNVTHRNLLTTVLPWANYALCVSVVFCVGRKLIGWLRGLSGCVPWIGLMIPWDISPASLTKFGLRTDSYFCERVSASRLGRCAWTLERGEVFLPTRNVSVSSRRHCMNHTRVYWITQQRIVKTVWLTCFTVGIITWI